VRATTVAGRNPGCSAVVFCHLQAATDTLAPGISGCGEAHREHSHTWNKAPPLKRTGRRLLPRRIDDFVSMRASHRHHSVRLVSTMTEVRVRKSALDDRQLL
jgi:hypothetical protein